MQNRLAYLSIFIPFLISFLYFSVAFPFPVKDYFPVFFSFLVDDIATNYLEIVGENFSVERKNDMLIVHLYSNFDFDFYDSLKRFGKFINDSSGEIYWVNFSISIPSYTGWGIKGFGETGNISFIKFREGNNRVIKIDSAYIPSVYNITFLLERDPTSVIPFPSPGGSLMIVVNITSPSYSQTFISFLPPEENASMLIQVAGGRKINISHIYAGEYYLITNSTERDANISFHLNYSCSDNLSFYLDSSLSFEAGKLKKDGLIPLFDVKR